jgi:predicted 2-oxoglutarate/Fe(II)-dependent dioxygenase YbiX/peroxiredoxin
MSLSFGEPAPLFSAPNPTNPEFAFGSLGGRYIVLVFLPPPSPEREAAFAVCQANLDLFRDDNCVIFGALPDAPSFALAKDRRDGMRWFLDADGEIARLYQAVAADGTLAPQWVLVDPTFRIMATAPLAEGAAFMQRLRSLPPAAVHAGAAVPAPVLVAPRILEPEFCQALIDAYEAEGGALSGVMRVVDGKTVPVLDGFKRRRDFTLPQGELIEGLRVRLARRLLPQIEKAFQFKATRIERFIVACYDADEGGWFHPHRDNTTPGTAHRRFAVSINLNDAFEGGDLRFPEFGRQTYRPPPGGAVVFSCSLLHEATPVTKGRRYATLPFLYDEAAAQIRLANLHTFPQAAASPPPQPAGEAVSPPR